VYGSIAELMAADPSFSIPGVVPSRKEPILPKEPPETRREIFDVPTKPIRTRPGGVRLPLAQSDMQEKMQPALSPVQKAQMDANRFLDEYMGLGQDMGDTAQQRIYPSWTIKSPFMPNYSGVRRELRKLGVRKHDVNEYVYDSIDDYIGHPEDWAD
jgi:hypothetical protein